VMCPTRLRKTQRLKIADKGFDLLGSGKHERSL
jgi:hypothetical protein